MEVGFKDLFVLRATVLCVCVTSQHSAVVCHNLCCLLFSIFIQLSYELLMIGSVWVMHQCDEAFCILVR